MAKNIVIDDEIVMSTTNNIDGHRVSKYINVESVEIVMGTGIFSEFTGDIQDFFGVRSTMYEGKLADAKKTAASLIKHRAYELGGNAIIGIDVDYTEFSGDRIAVIINGTIVRIEPVV